MVESKDFKEFVQLLNEHKVCYLVVGGYAMAFHGHPRYTKDMDVWVGGERENIEKLLTALTEFGFGSVGLKAEDFLDPEIVVQLGYPPYRIDILTDLKGVDFQTCYSRKQQLDVDGIMFNFIDLDNLRRNKQSSGRLQDLADLEKLQ